MTHGRPNNTATIRLCWHFFENNRHELAFENNASMEFVRILGRNFFYVVNTVVSVTAMNVPAMSQHAYSTVESMASMESHGDSFSETGEVDLEFPHVEVSLIDRLS